MAGNETLDADTRSGPAPALSNRDAILVVQQRSDVRSGQLLLFDGKQVRTYQPEDFRLF